VAAPNIRVSAEPIDAEAEERRLLAQAGDVGALVAFTGLCRDEGGALAALELEHYPGMAESEIEASAREAIERWPLQGLTVVHRSGLVKPGEKIVLVLAAARHRGEAFEAARFLMDYLKTRAPFWKKERRADGRPGGWVEAKASDEAAVAAWTKGRSP